jgi:hypothetical protein
MLSERECERERGEREREREREREHSLKNISIVSIVPVIFLLHKATILDIPYDWICTVALTTSIDVQTDFGHGCSSASSLKLDNLLQAEDAIKVLDTYEAQHVSALNLNSIQPPVMPPSHHTEGTDHPPNGPDSFTIKIKLSDQLEPVWIRPRSDPVSVLHPKLGY